MNSIFAYLKKKMLTKTTGIPVHILPVFFVPILLAGSCHPPDGTSFLPEFNLILRLLPPAGTGTIADTTPPTKPTGLTALGAGPNQANLTWGASTDETTQSSKLIYEVCSALSAAGCDSFTVSATTGTGGTSVSVVGLTESTLYYFTVRAKDEAGNAGIVSDIASATTTGANTVNSPTFNPGAGTYSSTQSVAIQSLTDGAIICYTSDGTTPACDPTPLCTAGTQYSTRVSVSSTQTLKAIACKATMTNSIVTPANYTINGTVAQSLPMKTNQTQCWDNSGTLIACTGTGHDGEYQYGRAADFTGPTQHPTYTSDYTTTDNVTGLVWKTCAGALTGLDCAGGTSTSIGYTVAETNCANLNTSNSGAGYAGIKTWRLPTVVELESIINYNSASPSIFAIAFPGTPSSGFWTSSSYLIDTASVWYISFDQGGRVLPIDKSSTFHHVRCVSD